MKILPINTKSKKYNIYVGHNLIAQFNKIIKKEKISFKKSLIIVDKNVPKKFLKRIYSKFKCEKKLTFFFNSSEKNKNIFYANSILKILFKNNFSRNDVIICLGGGISGDVAGFAASIYKRGLIFINIPSTLLSQVDSSIGGKTGVNNKFGKNLIGSFYQPDLVISDTLLLQSLPKREIICGYAEILKHSLIKNKKFFLFLSKNLKNILNLENKFITKAIIESCKIKKQIIEKDEKETNLRKTLNLGHTFGHAYEATLNYSKKLNHGEAVLYGIFSAAQFSKKFNFLNNNDYKLLISHLSNLGFVDLNKFFSKKHLNKIVNFMIFDKKNDTKKINLIILKKIGKVNISNQFYVEEIKKFINSNLLK
jgi:3-dehydroquinate synthase/shikimate kinase/3-dehydroquinate synthase|tara:strand:+ start:292 stop:1389 length:1098 start_codon:yes stop_codon:yes gene_type:complete